MSLVWSSGFNGIKAGITDIDAAEYIYNVEQQDGQELEYDLIRAYDDFIVGCKADGIWNAIKSSCIMAGARTLNGALVPLAGTAPTNYNFISSDYDRKLGLLGNTTSKYLDTNTPHNATPQNNVHMSVYTRTDVVDATIPIRFYIAVFSGSGTAIGGGGGNPSTWVAHDIGSSPPLFDDGGKVGFYGVSRNNSSNYNRRINSVTTLVNRTASSTPPGSGNVHVFARGAQYFAPARMPFYSFGESLDLALLDARVTTLINTIGAVLP